MVNKTCFMLCLLIVFSVFVPYIIIGVPRAYSRFGRLGKGTKEMLKGVDEVAKDRFLYRNKGK